MFWKRKAILHTVVSGIPGGSRVRYLAQRYATRTLPSNDEILIAIVMRAKKHVELIRKHQSVALQDASIYEFGAGWDAVIPLTFYCLGIESQVIVDLQPAMRTGVVNSSIERLQRMGTELNLPRVPQRRIGRQVMAELESHFGIRYIAPCDARATGLPARHFSFATSTDTLEHIPTHDIPAVLAECRRILQPGGSLSVRIDYRDHYSFVDASIGSFNFLRYDSETWRRWNPRTHYQNRLRHRDHVQLIREAGFELLEECREDGSESDRQILERTGVVSEFSDQSLRELTVKTGYIVARAPS